MTHPARRAPSRRGTPADRAVLSDTSRIGSWRATPGENPWEGTLRSHENHRPRAGRSSRIRLALLAAPAVLLLSGCSETVQRGWLPSASEGATNQTGRITDLWVNSWIAALLVGALTWGLMLWCVVAYRRRRDETGYPAQIRYHLPLEIMYTVLPLMMVAVLFFYTARDESAIADTSDRPDVTINVVAKQWAWDWNYLGDANNPNDDAYEVGLQGQLDGRTGVEKELPTLWLPQGKKVEFLLTARDVIHSFWIPAFLYKMDVIPGVENKFQVTPTRLGEFKGKCAELCGEYHSEMLFNVKVVTPAEYDQHIADLRAAGQTGTVDSNLGRSKTPDNGQGGAVPGNGTGLKVGGLDQ